MYKLIKARSIVRIPPSEFGKPLEEIALNELRQQYQERLFKELGLVLAILNVKVNDEGILVFGDGATYHEVEFEMLTYVPVPQEVIEGEVLQVDNYGIFVNLGPMDGLVHISQIADDSLKYDSARGIIIGEKSKKVIQKGDKVRARIISVASAATGRLPRVALTMRQPYLGKIEWLTQTTKK
ncbi:DNA-directed RNA polymerase [Saccharolobus caldissimus]|uniref:DNA-directed RNA polymerase subunit Rpo7 n=1 Tax=Saccharolobus caldissimus TaxID=1702097 RepID=A0AAQ4CP66_9CREN|nr:DNA-directed RNA polymerase [Saccharolobus caldissimus]BDB97597.1 DNA-directed RNA polymerase [Saccharolobus caldissimus]